MRRFIGIFIISILAACASTPMHTPAPTQPNVSIEKPKDSLTQARERNQHWLATDLLDALPQSESTYRPPLRLAVLLPQSGPAKMAGNAVRDGILSAYYAETRSKPDIQFYDTKGNAEGAQAAYQNALKDGAQMIIGPLSKDEVLAVSELANRIPVVALNKLTPSNNSHVLNFSLSPEREGELLAMHLIASQRKNVVVLYSADENNQRMLASMETNLQNTRVRINSKTIVLATNKNSPNEMLSLPDSLSQADGIVLLMNGNMAKTVRPQLALVGANQIALMASSEVSVNSDAKTNAQLDGIVFMQMPWLADQNNVLNINSNALKPLPSAKNSGARLQAFGLDAWLIATQLSSWLKNPHAVLNGATGTLTMDPDGQVIRRMPWFVFKNGVPQSLHEP